MTKNYPIITWLQRNWMLLIAMLFSNWLAMTEYHFERLGSWVADENLGGIWVAKTPMEFYGTILWAPAFAIAMYLIAGICSHLYYRQTIDADIHSGQYLQDWKDITAKDRMYISAAVRVGTLIAFAILLSGLAKAGEVDQVDRWDRATVNPKHRMALDVQMTVYRNHQARYENIQRMRPNGVPAPILFCLHYRESDNNFKCHAHEGSSLLHRTRDEPKGRPLHPEPPYTFEQSAEDAYYIYEKPTLDKINWSLMQAALDKMESFNGFGYRKKGIAAPYLWSGTSIYYGGKYVKDGVFSRTAMDQQLGCATILKYMQSKGIKVSFIGSIAFRANANLRILI